VIMGHQTVTGIPESSLRWPTSRYFSSRIEWPPALGKQCALPTRPNLHELLTAQHEASE
jgi:hypothetical protein